MALQISDKKQLKQVFPKALHPAVQDALCGLSFADENPPQWWSQPLNLSGEQIRLPYRLNAQTTQAYASLAQTPRLIADCLMTRHCDGRVRQHHLCNLAQPLPLWAVPFVVRLVGEYVLEIIDDIEANFDEGHSTEFAQFLNDNRPFVTLTSQRVTSYWNCYYRGRFPIKTDYAGFRVLDRWQRWIQIQEPAV